MNMNIVLRRRQKTRLTSRTGNKMIKASAKTVNAVRVLLTPKTVSTVCVRI